MSPSSPIFEPELAFLPFSCECGSRVASLSDLELHQREVCIRRWWASDCAETFGFELPKGRGVADGGRRA
jgi:hypothetical protein